MDYLLRDCANICGWFRGKGLEVDEQEPVRRADGARVLESSRAQGPRAVDPGPSDGRGPAGGPPRRAGGSPTGSRCTHRPSCTTYCRTPTPRRSHLRLVADAPTPRATLVQALHDHAIDGALTAWVAGRHLVGVMAATTSTAPRPGTPTPPGSAGCSASSTSSRPAAAPGPWRRPTSAASSPASPGDAWPRPSVACRRPRSGRRSTSGPPRR